MKRLILILSILIGSSILAYSQGKSSSYELIWQPSFSINNSNILNFNDAIYEDNTSLLPYFYECIDLNKYYTSLKVELENQQFIALSKEELKNVKSIHQIKKQINVKYKLNYSSKKQFAQISFVPIRRNPSTNQLEKLTSFTIKITGQEIKKAKSLKSYAQSSVLSEGKWVKISISEDGIYKLSYSDLINMGIPNPATAKIYGNGGGMLPLSNGESRKDDLVENAIWISKGNDGIFNEGDYILFYGQGPNIWKYDELNKKFIHSLHHFSNKSYYYVTSNSAPQKRITTITSLSSNATHIITSFNDFSFHEEEKSNLIKSGSTWVGEHFDITTSYDFDFSFPNIITSSPATFTSSLYARSSSKSSFTIKANNTTIKVDSLSAVNIGSSHGTYASFKSNSTDFNPKSSNLKINITYNKTASSSEGWLNFFSINVRRALKMSGNFMPFQDVQSIGSDNISEFQLSNTNSTIKIWETTNPLDIKEVQASSSGGATKFKVATDDLRRFVAFNENSYKTPTIIGEINNQNLHGFENINMIIVSHPLFLTHANQLANLHRNNDDLNVKVVTPEQIHNEFSSGKPDVAAIRDFAKMLYEKSTTFKYLLLFGDGSYDNRTNSSDNSNFILTYQSENSTSIVNSFVTDDFFGLLDDNEGYSNGLLDIGIGRLPVKNKEEAKNAVAKIINYTTNTQSLGNWRNTITLIADDEDSMLHIGQSDDMAQKIDTVYPEFNINKIYLDAYPQVSTPAGQRYPDVNLAIKNSIEKGTLIFNYTGHSNELGLSHEQILNINEILEWENKFKLPLFITASCEFSRFDDFKRTSGGEHIFLNPNGGGIALLTTTRLVFAGANFRLNNKLYDFLFQDKDYRLGDIIRLTKINSGSDTNKRNFVLLGDPALKLAIPKYKAITTSVVNSDKSDTLKALSKVTIKGNITNNENIKQTDFNGIIYPTVYDKSSNLKTLNNDGDGEFSFDIQNNIIYKGKASIKNGDFSFTFIVPKDISYNIGNGKISYYCYKNNANMQDGNGVSKDIIIGGTSSSIQNDTIGPVIQLYINNENFVYGGITDENPKIYAILSDSSGVNTVGNGIGHDITALIDENSNNTFILNDYYESELDNYQKGKIEYQLSDLKDGSHNLKLKVWDVYNNSSEEYIEFIVAKSSELVLEHIFNYPNPFTTNTSFYFDHNQPYSNLDVLIQVFTITGKLIKTIDTQVNSDGFRSNPIKWDGLDDFGDKIGKGVYVYRLQVRAPNGKNVNKFEKLVILR